MTDRDNGGARTVDVGAYCRRVEDHLTRVNAGHLVRVVGPGFELARQWAEAGVPLSVVFRGIDAKAERHKAGASNRPLRLEFCAADVEAVFDNWRRAIGLSAWTASLGADGTEGEPDAAATRDVERKRPSLGRHFERVIDRLSRALARADLPDSLRELGESTMTSLVELRDESAGARGSARDAAIARLSELDDQFGAAVVARAPAEEIDVVRREAAADLHPFRGRLDEAAWDRSVFVTTDRLLRDRFGLPMLTL